MWLVRYISISLIFVSMCFASTEKTLRTGVELGIIATGSGSTIHSPEGWATNGSTGVSIATNIVKSGNYSIHLNATSGVACEATVRSDSVVFWPQVSSNDGRKDTKLGMWFYFVSAPSAKRTILALGSSGSGRGTALKLRTDMKLEYYNGATLYRTSTATLPMGQWTWIGVDTYLGKTAAGTAGFKIFVDNVAEQWDTTGINYGITVNDEDVSYFSAGDASATAGTFDMYIDDVQINVGVSCDYPSNTTALAYMFPIADSAISTWTASGGGTSNLFSNVDNIPYTYTTESSSNTIVNANASGVQKITFSLTKPQDAGIVGIHTIMDVSYHVRYSSHTSAAAQTLRLNPSYNASTNVNVDKVTSASAHGNDNATTHGNWRTAIFINQVGITKANWIDSISPSITVEKLTATSTQMCVSAVWAIVEYLQSSNSETD